MTSADALRLYVHESAWEEATQLALDPVRMTASVRSAVRRELGRTGGSTWKKLSSPAFAFEWRLRLNKRRVVCSLVDDAQGRNVFVHFVAPRDEVYKSPQLTGRVAAFHREVWDVDAGGLRQGRAAAAYVRIDGDDGVEPLDGTVEPQLTAAQLQYLGGLLAPQQAADAAVLLGQGPPGSGKTLVAAEAVVAAAQTCDVLVLVPTRRLLRHYESALEQDDLALSSYGEAPDGDGGQVCVEELRAFFAARCAYDVPETTRHERLVLWWSRACETASLRVWCRRHPEVREPGFVALLDAVLEDEDLPVGRRRDALHARQRPLLDRIEELRRRDEWVDELRRSRADAGLRLRCELGREALPGLRSGPRGERPLLVIVDECQDLVPAEWRTLVRWCAERLEAGAPTRLALLGDVHQRIAPTAFTWEDVSEFAIGTVKLPESRVRRIPIEHRTFRLSRQIAAAAQVVMDERVLEPAGARRERTVIGDGLPERAPVDVVVVANAWKELQAAARRVADELEAQRRLFVVDAFGHPLLEDGGPLESLHVPEAKGLEFPTLAVVNPVRAACSARARHLPYEHATIAYTALSRASERMLCVMEPEEWELLSRAPDLWRAAGVDEPIHLTGGSGFLLDEVVSRAMQRPDRGLEIEVLRAKLLAAPAMGADSPAEIAARCLRLARRLVELDGHDHVVLHGDELLEQHPELRVPLRRELMHAASRGDVQSQVAGALLLGEISAAAHVGIGAALAAMVRGECERFAVLLLDAGASERWALSRRDEGQVEVAVPTASLARSIMLEQVERFLEQDLLDGLFD